MENNSFIRLVAAQLSGLHATALSELGTSHALTFTLGQALAAAEASTTAADTSISYDRLVADVQAAAKPAAEFVAELPAVIDALQGGRENAIPVDLVDYDADNDYDAEDEDNLTPIEVQANLPLNVQVEATEGVSEDEIADALEAVREAAPEATGYADETGEVVETPTAEVFAEVPTADGGVVTIGDESNFDRLKEMFPEDADEEDGQEPQIVISYRRLDGQEFTREELDSVIGSRVSQAGLQRLGARAMWEAEQNEDKTAFRTTWFVAEGDVPLAAIRANCAMYQGSHPFPGVGLVEAKASPYEA